MNITTILETIAGFTAFVVAANEVQHFTHSLLTQGSLRECLLRYMSRSWLFAEGLALKEYGGFLPLRTSSFGIVFGTIMVATGLPLENPLGLTAAAGLGIWIAACFEAGASALLYAAGAYKAPAAIAEVRAKYD